MKSTIVKFVLYELGSLRLLLIFCSFFTHTCYFVGKFYFHGLNLYNELYKGFYKYSHLLHKPSVRDVLLQIDRIAIQ